MVRLRIARRGWMPVLYAITLGLAPGARRRRRMKKKRLRPSPASTTPSVRACADACLHELNTRGADFESVCCFAPPVVVEKRLTRISRSKLLMDMCRMVNILDANTAPALKPHFGARS